VVLITIDTCRADRIGCHGGRVRTPAIDSIGESGTVFLQATATAPLTLPSHGSILTGLYPLRHTVRDNGAGRIPEDAVTLPEVLRDAGWNTAAFVAAYPVAGEFGTSQGFARFDDDFTGNAAGAATGGSREIAERLFYDERNADDVVDAAIPWLEEAVRGPAPFLLWLHFFDPHAVYQPPPRQASVYGGGSYEGEVAFVDEQIGRVLEVLQPVRDQTVVCVTADHGESLGEHEETTHGLFVYESTLHVPWVMEGPGVPAGVRVEDPVSLVQVLPTVLDAVAVEAPPGMDGQSALPLARGEASGPESVFGESLYPLLHFDWAALRSVRRGRWKLIDAPRPELFDLASDPGETVNLADDHPERVREMRAELERHHSRGPALGGTAPAIDDEARRRLEGLGYVGGGGSYAADGDSDPWNAGGEDPRDMVGVFNGLQEIPTLMMNGRFDEAGALLAELRVADPENLTILRKAALLERTRENWEEARRLCEEVLQRDPEDARTRRNMAFVARQAGDLSGAERIYRDMAARDSTDADAWALLGSLLSEAGRHDEAVRSLARACRLNEADAVLRTEHARALEEDGRVEEALAAYDGALALDAALPGAINGKALLLSHTGRAEEAARLLTEGVEGRGLGQDVEVLNNLAWILADRGIDPARGFAMARRARGLSPEDPAVLDTFGWAAIQAGEPGVAVDALKKAWRATQDAEVRAHLGIALARTGREKEGRGHLRAAFAERPGLADKPGLREWTTP
jgi:arylsulfatase A-like enzyme/Flp pilus assembly protein TadD